MIDDGDDDDDDDDDDDVEIVCWLLPDFSSIWRQLTPSRAILQFDANLVLVLLIIV